MNPGNGTTNKLIFVVLAALFTATLAISGFLFTHQISVIDGMDKRLSVVEQQAAKESGAAQMSRQEIQRRLSRIEEKIDQIQKDIR